MKPIATIVSSDPARARELTHALGALGEDIDLRLFPSVRAAQAGLPGLSPRLVCIDVAPPGSARQWEAACSACGQFQPGAVVLTGGSGAAPDIDHAERNGVSAYFPWCYTPQQKAAVLAVAWAGLRYFPRGSPPAELAGPGLPSLAEALGAPPNGPSPNHGLTERQLDVLACASSGMNYRQIAARLAIEVGTVKQHMTAIHKKLRVGSRAQAAVLGQRMEAVLGRMVAFGEQGHSILDWLMEHVGHRHHAANEVLFRKGDPGGELYYLQRGFVVFEELGDEYGAGRVFGEVGAFSPTNRRTSTARCRTDVEVFVLNADHVKHLCYENPGFAMHIMQQLASRVASARGL